MSHVKRTLTGLSVGVAISMILAGGIGMVGAAITSITPTNGSTLTDGNQLFVWTDSGSTTEYWLYVGSSLGANDLFNSGSLGTATSTTASGLPTNGSTLHVRLWNLEGGNWLTSDFTYTAFARPSAGGPNVPTWAQALPATERFVPVFNGAAILDNETELVWEQAPQTTTSQWMEARVACTSRTVGGRSGWRLPSVNELASLIDMTNTSPTLPTSHPFSNIWPSRYWSATTSADSSTIAWNGHFGTGEVGRSLKSGLLFTWCVRGGGYLSQY